MRQQNRLSSLRAFFSVTHHPKAEPKPVTSHTSEKVKTDIDCSPGQRKAVHGGPKPSRNRLENCKFGNVTDGTPIRKPGRQYSGGGARSINDSGGTSVRDRRRACLSVCVGRSNRNPPTSDGNRLTACPTFPKESHGGS